MTKRLAIAIAVFSSLAVAGVAQAQERPSAVGVGVQGLLGGGVGPSLVFQTADFHVEGILSFSDVGDDTDLGLAGRFWYAVSQTGRSDFSVGGGLGLLINDEPGEDSELDVEFDLGAQLRAFVVPNVALSATLGFAVIVQDGSDFVGLTGDLVGDVGIAYFF